MELLLVFILAMAVILIGAQYVVRQRPPSVSQRMTRLSVAFDEIRLLIGGALLPAFQSVVKAAKEFDEEWMRMELVMEPSTCPWCGLTKKVYVRAGSELVCTDCVRDFEASEGSV